MAAEAGDALGARYRLIERIGAGASGEVWRVGDERGPDLAAKLLHAEHARDPALVERFVRERSVLVRLRHPRVVEVRDLVVEGDTIALVMELITGGSLRGLLEREGPLPAGRALPAVASLLDALAAAHAEGTVHRDVKPDNVLLAARAVDLGDAVRVSDFGIAHVLAEGSRSATGIVGTPEYVSPEMLATGAVGPPADIYSTGILLHELLAGSTPFAGPGTAFSVAYRHVSMLPPPLDLPPRLASLLDSMLAKDPGARPTAPEAAATLRRLAPELAALPALPRAASAPVLSAADRPLTLLRHEAPVRAAVPQDDGPAPDLGPSSRETIVRPVPRREFRIPPTGDAAPARRRNRTAVLAGIVAGALLVGAVVVAVLPRRGVAPGQASEESPSVRQLDRPLPTGLGVSRSAQWDPARSAVVVVLSYSAQSAPLSGDLLEVLPGLDADAPCPAVSWSGASAVRNRVSATGVGAPCGWSLSGVDIPAQGIVEVVATVEVAPSGQAALDEWLTGAAAATSAAVADPGVSGSAFPVQRLRDVRVETPGRTVIGSTLPVSLVPVWPSGADPVDPLLVSPSLGAAGSVLDAVAGGLSGVRFTDGCGGAVAVSSDGLTATALSVTPSCVLRARVGAFTDLSGDPFAITTRD